jgi:hypothetical protein
MDFITSMVLTSAYAARRQSAGNPTETPMSQLIAATAPMEGFPRDEST